MKVFNTSGQSIYLEVTSEQMDEFYGKNRSRLLQDIFPKLIVCEREFMQTELLPGKEQIEIFGGGKKKCRMCPLAKCKYK
mgnify:CR=1 FL=1